MFNQSIIINMDSYTKYVQIRTEALEAEVKKLKKIIQEYEQVVLDRDEVHSNYAVHTQQHFDENERLRQENYDLKVLILGNEKTFPKLFHK